MRDYGKISPSFWTGKTGKAIKAAGPEAIVVSMYLMSSPHSNMIGLYYLPMMYLAHESGLGFEGASKGLRRASEAGFCSYDEASEVVFVHEMARYQIADSLNANDNRVKGIQREVDSVPENPFITAFYEKYGSAFNLKKQPENTSPLQAPSKPLRSQEQEQEQEQEQNKPARKRSPSRSVAAPVVELPDWLPAERWGAFTAMRKQIKKPLSQDAAELALSTLAKLKAEGHDPVECLNNSILNSWSGIFAPKPATTAKPIQPQRNQMAGVI